MPSKWRPDYQAQGLRGRPKAQGPKPTGKDKRTFGDDRHALADCGAVSTAMWKSKTTSEAL
jgi:hypothetical protein